MEGENENYFQKPYPFELFKCTLISSCEETRKVLLAVRTLRADIEEAFLPELATSFKIIEAICERQLRDIKKCILLLIKQKQQWEKFRLLKFRIRHLLQTAGLLQILLSRKPQRKSRINKEK